MAYARDGGSSHVLLSRPHRIVWAGFSSDTWTLQQHGWAFSAHENMQHRSVQLLLKQEKYGLYGVSQNLGYIDFFQSHSGYRYVEMPECTFELEYMGPDQTIRAYRIPIPNFDVGSFNAVDMQPMMAEVSTMKTLEERYALFAKPLVRTQEIIVAPQSVAECLEHIKRLQDPEMAAIRERNRQRAREEMKAGPREVFHAQIISLSA